MTATDPLTAPPSAALLGAARDWIADCWWADLDSDDVDELTDREVIDGIRYHYAGGWPAFVRDSLPATYGLHPTPTARREHPG
jgi:hypothetical protein